MHARQEHPYHTPDQAPTSTQPSILNLKSAVSIRCEAANSSKTDYGILRISRQEQDELSSLAADWLAFGEIGFGEARR